MKLIRDKLADTEWSLLPEGRAFVRPVRNSVEHGALLDAKLLEEAAELFRAVTAADITAELADLLTVLQSYAEMHKVSWAEVETARERKDAERGTFTRGVVWDI